LNAVEEIAKMLLWCNLGSKKTARLSQQLQGRHIQNLAVMVTERRSLNTFVLVFRFAVLLSNYTRSKSHHRQTVGQNWQIFAPQNVGDTDRASLICVIKLHHIPTSWQRSRGAIFCGLEDLSAKNKSISHRSKI